MTLSVIPKVKIFPHHIEYYSAWSISVFENLIIVCMCVFFLIIDAPQIITNP